MTNKADERIAPAGHIWECQVCKKRAKDKYGDLKGNRARGWDASCMIYAVLVKDNDKDATGS